jgi:hypothetical protein
MKNNKIDCKSTTTQAKEKFITDLEPFEFYKFLMHV